MTYDIHNNNKLIFNEKALDLANKNDLVLITGKGAEQAICVSKGKKIDWDDRKVTKKLLKNI